MLATAFSEYGVRARKSPPVQSFMMRYIVSFASNVSIAPEAAKRARNKKVGGGTSNIGDGRDGGRGGGGMMPVLLVLAFVVDRLVSLTSVSTTIIGSIVHTRIHLLANNQRLEVVNIDKTPTAYSVPYLPRNLFDSAAKKTSLYCIHIFIYVQCNIIVNPLIPQRLTPSPIHVRDVAIIQLTFTSTQIMTMC